MDADEDPWINLRFDSVDGIPQQVRSAGEVKAHIVTFSLYGIDILSPNKDYFLAFFDCESLKILRTFLKLIEQPHDAFGVGIARRKPQSVLSVIQGLRKSLAVERFHQVVDRVDIKRAKCMLV